MVIFPTKVKFNFPRNFPGVYFILKSRQTYFLLYLVIFLFFYFLFFFKIFIIKNCWCFRQSKNNIFIRDNFFFWFFFFNYPFKLSYLLITTPFLCRICSHVWRSFSRRWSAWKKISRESPKRWWIICWWYIIVRKVKIKIIFIKKFINPWNIW